MRLDAEIEKLRSQNERLKTILRHLFPEKSGKFFICGATNERDDYGLPTTILVCPAYGADGAATYSQTRPYCAPGW